MAIATNDGNSAVLHRTRHDRDRDGPVSEAIVEALAAVESVEPDELDVRLYDDVDPEALDRLYGTAAERADRLHLSFDIAEYEVVLTDDGDLLVCERADGPNVQ